MTSQLRAVASSSVVHVLFAFMAMGSWAVFANRAHPMPQPLVAGAVQGALSALITLFLKSGIDHLSKRVSGSAAYWAPPVIVLIVSISLLTAFHWLSGTPEIASTIAVPLAVSTSYAALYNFSLARNRRQP
ncbi:MAG: hypothetical protein KUA43_02080 [Hoeflea sp.]|uniref:hypothetical protein n=1 Tax=Hoeflea sp. TaxID=1940281 RepID=UPI001D60C8FC|nr:hypothetical protein [Hoeflea sp.]MBU4530661.1 hypothetical protein [Alphaproteobacteria bacterium]MBU4544881.1 hypothetical protein [Alphaproteobacteria bacterium]MBU4552024.1 hypothetical protein [Alphaproteobacteria bacterium]MBV1722213.1 hypothetical protein [Hoeflea sp.]MBV1761775.1 hypothetical protein [Hoeflea sp.]